MTDNNDRNWSGYVAALTVGALAGAGIALLLAPRSGRDTRDAIARQACELKDKAEQILAQAKSVVSGKQSELSAAVDAVKDAIRDERVKQSKSA